jgi:hypothetical protein
MPTPRAHAYPSCPCLPLVPMPTPRAHAYPSCSITSKVMFSYAHCTAGALKQRRRCVSAQVKGGTKAHKTAEKRARLLEIEVRQLRQQLQRVEPTSSTSHSEPAPILPFGQDGLRALLRGCFRPAPPTPPLSAAARRGTTTRRRCGAPTPCGVCASPGGAGTSPRKEARGGAGASRDASRRAARGARRRARAAA